ncbi:MAG: hypothetical protein ACLQBB_11905 [Solirubrobacteraceae bacterium]
MSAWVGYGHDEVRLHEGSARRRAHVLASALAALVAALAALLTAHLASGPQAAVPRAGRAAFSEAHRLPLPLRAELSTAQGTTPAYRVEPAPDGALQARGGGIATSFSRNGVSLRGVHAVATLALARVSEAGATVALSAPLPRAEGNRVEYARGAVSEWYANGPYGVEQGFTIARGRPGALTIALAAHGTTTLRVHRGSVELGGGLRYGALSAVDASGRRLPSRLAVRDGRIVLDIDAAGARFPVRVDPFVSQEALHYSEVPDDGEGPGGVAISGDGDTAVVGAAHPSPGAVYVFQRGGNGLWTLQQTLSPGGPDGYYFGSHVALSEDGETLLVSAETSSNLGHIWTYTLDEGVWVPDVKTLDDPIKTNPGYDHDKPGFEYGNALAVSGNGSVALVADEPQGAAVLYQRDGGEWEEVTSFSDGKGLPSEYGIAIALSGNGEDALVAAPATELVYSYDKNGSTWEQSGTFPYFAYDGQRNVSVAIDRGGDTAISGEYFSGNARVWIEKPGSGKWEEQADIKEPGGPSEEELGSDVSLSASGSKALVLAFGFEENELVYEFTRSGTVWSGGEPISMPYGVATRSTFYIPEAVLSAEGDTALLWSKFATLPSVYTDTPAVHIGAASELGTTAATLKGTVNPAGETVTTCRFEYGTSLSYGSTKACTPTPAGAEPVQVSGSVTGLSSGTTYHFRLAVTTGAGTFHSSDATFTTFTGLATAKTEKGSETAKATLGKVSATASGGTGSITIGAYGANAGEPPLPSSTGSYLDVYRSTSATFKEVEIKACEVGSAQALWAYGKGGWEPVSPAATLSEGCLRFTASSTSRPSVAELEGFKYKIGEPAGQFGECRAQKDAVYSEGACLTVHESKGAPDGKGKYEWYPADPGLCFPEKKGEFEEGACKTRDEKKGKPAGKYELTDGAFTSSISKVVLEVQGAEKIECAAGTGSGEFSSPEKGSETITLEKCKQKSTDCSSGAAAETIVGSPLEVIVLQSATGGEFELALAAAQFATFACGSTSYAIEGAAVGTLTGDKNTMSTTTEASFTAAGSQLIDLSGSTEISAKLSMSLTTTSRQPLEVNTDKQP